MNNRQKNSRRLENGGLLPVDPPKIQNTVTPVISSREDISC